MKTLLILTTAVGLVVGPSVATAEEQPMKPGAEPGAHAVQLPLRLEDGDSLRFEVTRTPLEPLPQDLDPDAAEDPLAPAAPVAIENSTLEYRIDVREADEGIKVLRVFVGNDLPVADDSGHKENGVPEDDRGVLRRFDVTIDEDGRIQEARTNGDGDMLPDDRDHLMLVLGSGLHGINLGASELHTVGGLRLRFDAEATAASKDDVVFAVEPAPLGAVKPSPEADGDADDASEGLVPTGRAVFDAEDGLLDELELPADPEGGRKAIQIRRVQPQALVRQPG